MQATQQSSHNRWLIAIMGTLLMIALGTVYAWSFFQKPIIGATGWSNAQAAWAFSTAILFLGLAAAWGGIKLPKYGPTKLAIIGALMYGLGYVIGGIALQSQNLVLLYLGFGVIGGSGMGLGYVTPVATVGKWFPDKKGFATGMVVMGFGLGALVMSKVIGPALMDATGGNLTMTFIYSGLLLMLAVGFAAFLRNPPAGYLPPGYQPPVTSAAAQQAETFLTGKDAILSRKWAAMWLVFFINICAGIMFIGFQSPMLQDILAKSDSSMTKEALAAAGATLIAVSSLFNGVGRFFWGGLSDKIGRAQTFRVILGSQILVFFLLRYVSSPILFSVMVCYVLLCYGGGFGTMPSFVLDVFGAKLMPVVYGAILTAWSLAGVAGPQLAAAIKDSYQAEAGPLTFTLGAAILAVGFGVSFFVNNARFIKPGIPAAGEPASSST
jgi:OFA family oxalate/formate antiporter-like MFS transporter